MGRALFTWLLTENAAWLRAGGVRTALIFWTACAAPSCGGLSESSREQSRAAGASTGRPLTSAAVLDGGAADAGADAASADPGSDAGARSCIPAGDAGLPTAGDVNIDLAVEFQTISGFGGINVPGWIDDLTPEQVDTAFGNGPGQIGMSLLRVRIPYDPAEFALEVPTAVHAVALGARVIASPWTPPPELKTVADIVGGELRVDAYDAYAEHLLSFRDYMASNGVALHAISVQNEPDIRVTYESCSWTAAQMIDWLTTQGSKFEGTPLIAAESFNFNRAMTDPILNDPAAAAPVGIIGGHIYGRGLADYPLARSLGKEVWMTEHYTDSSNPANAWPLALNVGKELHDSMSANFNAYIWWYIRRSYGPLTEDGLVSKRGYLMAQYAKFVRPGYVRVAASQPAQGGVFVTAYEHAGDPLVLVAVNQNTSEQNINLAVHNGCADSFDRFTTSASKNLSEDGPVSLVQNRGSVTLDAQSVTTFVSR
ncbi:MAG TPA: glycoside hydrolase family 30 beta sandwich domain-containing protein [Polyangiaceae bacterium]|nr:glycoside hydrolase family 30 beta sandwich domain-containing protein [Polyangiaceae bacterium]